MGACGRVWREWREWARAARAAMYRPGAYLHRNVQPGLSPAAPPWCRGAAGAADAAAPAGEHRCTNKRIYKIQ